MPFCSRTSRRARVIDFEDGGHHRLVRAVANDVAGGFFAEQQRERVDQDGLAGAGFAGQQVQPGANSTTT